MLCKRYFRINLADSIDMIFFLLYSILHLVKNFHIVSVVVEYIRHLKSVDL